MPVMHNPAYTPLRYRPVTSLTETHDFTKNAKSASPATESA